MNLIDLIFLLQILIWAVALGAFLCSPQASIFHPCLGYLVFHLIVFIVRPILVHYYGFNHIFDRIGLTPSDDVQIRTLLVTSLTLVVFMVTCYAAGNARVAYASLQAPQFTPQETLGLKLTILVLLPLLVYSTLTTLKGIDVEQRGGVSIIGGAGGYVNDAQKMAGSLLAAWLLVTRFRWTGLVPVALFVAYRSYNGWSRWTIVLFLILAATTYAWYKRKKWPPVWLLLVALPLLPLFKFLGKNRDYFKYLVSGQHYVSLTKDTTYLSARDKFRVSYDNPDFANYDFLAYVIAVVPDQTGTYSYGAQYVQLFTEPIPRQLWAGKPAGSPISYFDLNQYGNFLGYTVSLPGDAWMTGGWVGVIIIAALVGGLLGWAHRWFWRNSNHNLKAMLYMAASSTLIQLYRDGGVVSVAKFLLWTCLPILIWMFITWMLQGCRVPGASIYLVKGRSVRFVTADVPRLH